MKKSYSAIFLTIFLAMNSSVTLGFNGEDIQDCHSHKEIAEKLIYKQSTQINSEDSKNVEPLYRRKRDCYAECAHLLHSPSGDLQSSEYRKCYRECKGTL